MQVSAAHDLSNTRHLLEDSIRLLASGECEVKRRLLTAYTQRLQYVLPEHLPEGLRPLLLSVRDRLSKSPTYKGQSVVESALHHMHRKTASSIAADIVELHFAIARVTS
jgi:hypothetical protein